MVKNLPANARDTRDKVRSLGGGDPLEEGMASHSSILAWRISMDRGAWWAPVRTVTKSWTRLKRLSTHTIISWGGGKCSGRKVYLGRCSQRSSTASVIVFLKPVCVYIGVH